MPDLAGSQLRARKRRRRWNDAVVPLFLGAAVALFTYGALSRRITDRDDLLSDPIEAAVLGVAFALGSFPRGWAIIPRAVIPVPTFFLYLSVFIGKVPPLPYGAAFTVAGCYALFFTALSSYFAEQPRNLRLKPYRQHTQRKRG